MSRSILQPRDGVMFAAKPADVTQKSTDDGNFGRPLEASEYSSIACQVYWSGIVGQRGTFQVQTSLKASPAEADWVDRTGASVTTSGASGTDLIILTDLVEKSVRVVWTPKAITAGTVSAELMAKGA